jgi:hypothetical protein
MLDCSSDANETSSPLVLISGKSETCEGLQGEARSAHVIACLAARVLLASHRRLNDTNVGSPADTPLLWPADARTIE